MLDVAIERGVEGDLLLGDMGEGLPFRAGIFDGAISISAVQWLCNADKKVHNPIKRLYTLFSTLYSVLRRGAKAVIQVYPENAEQMELITFQAGYIDYTVEAAKSGCLGSRHSVPIKPLSQNMIKPLPLY